MDKDIAQSAQAGAEALLANTRTPAQATQSDSFSGLPQSFLTQKDYGANIFKQFATDNVTTSDVDNQMIDLVNKKATTYADIIKYFKSIGQNISPIEAMAHVDSMHKNIDTQITNLQAEKSTRIQEAQKAAEDNYNQLKQNFIYQRGEQMQLDKDISNETIKPQSDPQKIADLMEQKQQVDKKVDSIKKQFKANGVDQPEAILRQESNEQINNQQTPDQGTTQSQPNMNKLLYDVGLGKYDDAKGQFDTKSFIDETQKLPEYKGLPKKALGEKLLSMDADKPALEDLFYVSNKLQDKPDAMVDVLRQKGLSDEDIAGIVLNGIAKNSDLGTYNSDTTDHKQGDPKDPVATKEFEALKKSLLSYGISKDIINNTLDNLNQ